MCRIALLVPLLLSAALLAGCDLAGRFARSSGTGTAAATVEGPTIRPARRPERIAPALPPPAGAATAAALDTTSAAEKAAALAPPADAGRSLGMVTVSLGSPAEPGFWLRGALVTAVGPGRVVTAAGGALAVELRPGAGAAQLSLPAFRALGLSLTDLPQVEVFAE
jgi:hypothetical protein